jgi:ribonucleoside-triphosphate reductase
VFHTFLGEAVKDWRACRDLVKTVTANYRIPYVTISPTFSVCRIHGYLNGEQFECPKCRAENEAKLRAQLAALEAEREAVVMED